MTLPPIKIRIRALFAAFVVLVAVVTYFVSAHLGHVLAHVASAEAALKAQGAENNPALSQALGDITEAEKTFGLGLWVVALSVGAVGALALIYFDQQVFQVLDRLSALMKRYSQRDFSQAPEGTHRSDELGTQAQALAILRDNGLALMRLERETQENAQKSEIEKRQALLALGAQLETQVASLVEGVARSSEAMSQSAAEMTKSAQAASLRAGRVSQTAEVTSDHAKRVAGTVQDLSHTAAAIARSTQEASDISMRASQEAESMSQLMARLGESAQQISAVVDMITSIAHQTNLLALNATIEASRAGAQGAGFAVVAAEVKTLSQQTERATRDITQKVQHIQKDAHEALGAIATIVGTITELRGSADEIAHSVSSQRAATDDISHTVDRLAEGSASVGDDIITVKDVAEKTGAEADVVLIEARSVTEASHELQGKISQFLKDIRAA